MTSNVNYKFEHDQSENYHVFCNFITFLIDSFKKY